MARTVTSVDDCVFVHSMFAGCTDRGLAQFDCWRVQELFLSCLNLCYGFKVSLLSAVRLASSAVLSSWRGLLSLTDCHLWPGQTWVKS